MLRWFGNGIKADGNSLNIGLLRMLVQSHYVEAYDAVLKCVEREVSTSSLCGGIVPLSTIP